MAVKKVLLAKKIDNTLYDFYPKTDSTIVVFGNETVYSALTALNNTVGNQNSGLVKDVNGLKAVGATKTEASSTNGNIKINNVETTVYDDTALAGRVTTAEGGISNIVDGTTSLPYTKINNGSTTLSSVTVGDGLTISNGVIGLSQSVKDNLTNLAYSSSDESLNFNSFIV